MKLAERLYRLALRACPESFRDEFGGESAGDFARLVSERRRSKGRLAAMVLTVRAVGDVVRTAFRERRAGRPESLKLSAIGQHLRDARRSLASRPGFTLVVLVTLALGIGANAAIFELVYEVLLRPLPFPNEEQLVALRGTDMARGSDDNDVTPPNFSDWRAMNGSFAELAAMVQTSMNLTGGGEPERLVVHRVSSSLFPLLGVEALHGRVFVDDEDREGGGRVVLLTHGLWQRRFGGRIDAVGSDMVLD